MEDFAPNLSSAEVVAPYLSPAPHTLTLRYTMKVVAPSIAHLQHSDITTGWFGRAEWKDATVPALQWEHPQTSSASDMGHRFVGESHLREGEAKKHDTAGKSNGTRAAAAMATAIVRIYAAARLHGRCSVPHVCTDGAGAVLGVPGRSEGERGVVTAVPTSRLILHAREEEEKT